MILFSLKKLNHKTTGSNKEKTPIQIGDKQPYHTAKVFMVNSEKNNLSGFLS